MKRRTSVLQALVPALTDWVLEPGDRVRAFSPGGDPRDPSTDLSEAYLAPDPFVLQPCYLSGFITVDVLSVQEIAELERILNADIPEDLLKKINAAVTEYVSTVALDRRLAKWKDIEQHLLLIIQTFTEVLSSAEKLIRLTDPMVLDESKSRGALSADQLIKKMIMDIPLQHRGTLDIDLNQFMSYFVEAYNDVQDKTKRGRKPNTAFRLMLSRVARSMEENGFDIKLPSNENVFDRTHPTFLFLCSVLDVYMRKGKLAVLASDLDEVEKDDAVMALAHYPRTQKAILHYFRDGLLP